jgi:hypothetical protein
MKYYDGHDALSQNWEATLKRSWEGLRLKLLFTNAGWDFPLPGLEA